jgi:hypothetical protein
MVCEFETSYLAVQHFLELAAHVKTQSIREQDAGPLVYGAQTVQVATGKRMFLGPLLEQFRRIAQPGRIDVLNRCTDGGAIILGGDSGKTV